MDGRIDDTVFCPAPFAVHDQAISGDEISEAVLECARRDRALQVQQNLEGGHAARPAADDVLDRRKGVLRNMVCQTTVFPARTF